jgi:hypothetical protein
MARSAWHVRCLAQSHAHTLSTFREVQATVPITFTDDDGVVWDVWEAKRPSSVSTEVAPVSSEVANYVMREGWLCFLSARGKRRLDRYPRFWSVLSEAALKRLCLMAEAVPHSEIRDVEEVSRADLLLGGESDSQGRGLERH